MKGTESLIDLVTVFDEADIPYMIVGSYSSNFYGIPRSTKDADLVVHLPSSDWANLSKILPDGIELEDQMSFEMVTSTRRELLRVRDSLFQIELFRLSDDSHDRSRFVQALRSPNFFLPLWATQSSRVRVVSENIGQCYPPLAVGSPEVCTQGHFSGTARFCTPVTINFYYDFLPGFLSPTPDN